MKYFFTQLYKTPMFFVFVLMVAFYGFHALGRTAEINQYAVVTAVGIDMAEEEEGEQLYEVTLLTFIPVAQQSFTESYKVFNAKGRSVSEAMDLASLNIGREIGLSHIKIIVLSKELIENGLHKFLDYLSRNVQVASSTKVVATDSTAKDFLTTAQNLDNESSIKVSEHIMYNSEYIYSTESSLETFFKGTFGPTKVGLMACLSPKSPDEQTMPTAASDSQGAGEEKSGSSGGSGTSTQDMITQCHVYVFKEGELVVTLGEREMKKVNFVCGDYTDGSIQVKNISDKHFTNANVTFEIFGKSMKYNVSYQNGIPVINIDTSLTLRMSEVEDETGMVKENVELFVISPEATKAIERKVKQSMAEGINTMRENQVDIADFYTLLYNNNKQAFKNFLDSLEDPEDYLNRIVFKIGVRILAK